jgi:hypothetical protein
MVAKPQNPRAQEHNYKSHSKAKGYESLAALALREATPGGNCS